MNAAIGLKLNLGCGFNRKAGSINVDCSDGCGADVRLDLAAEKWPWDTDSVSEVVFEFALEQMGENTAALKHVLTELYRVCAKDAKVSIVAAHPRHDQFFLNPLCHHRLSPDFFQLLSVQKNLSMISQGQHYDVLGLTWKVNFEVTRFKYLIAPEFREGFEAGKITEQELHERIRYENNVCQAFEVDLRVVK